MTRFNSIVSRVVAVGCLVFVTVGCQNAQISRTLAISAQCLDGSDWVDVTFKNLSREKLPLLIDRNDVLQFQVKQANGSYTASPPAIRPGADRRQIVVILPDGSLTRRVQLKEPFLADRAALASADDRPFPLKPVDSGSEATGVYGKLLVTYKTDDIDLAHPSNMEFWRGVIGPVDADRILLTTPPQTSPPPRAAQPTSNTSKG